VSTTSAPRRTLGLLAAGAIGLSVTFLGGGVASAEPATPAAGTEAPVAEASGVPWAPYLNWVQPGDESATVDFTAPDDNGVAITGYEVSTDGGGTWASVTTTGTGRLEAVVTDLTNGQTYSVVVRAQSADGGGDESVAMDVTPYAPLPASQNVVATAGSSFIKVTWDAPASGTVASYTVGYSMGEMGDEACALTAGEPRVCLFAATPGSVYSVTVFAYDADGNMGLPARVTPSAVAAPVVPTAVPTKTGDLTRPAGETGSVSSGTKVTLSGTGYLPNSTISVAIYSTPQVLTTVVTDGTGSFTVEVTVPDGLASGQHTLVASGVDSLGNVRYLNLPVTVVGGTTGSGGLAYTGASVTGPVIGGVAALAIGAGLLVASRRRANG
jgi:hypothetical protein